MTRKYLTTLFTDPVQEAQKRFGARELGRIAEGRELADDELSLTELAFIAQRDFFYMASISESGWPYLQFRGGPAGFLKVLDTRTLAFGDFRGNRQYISTGNLNTNPRCALFFMDYAKRKRLKVLAKASVFAAEDRPELLAEVRDPESRGVVERIYHFEIHSYDWNCPQHITPRFTEAEFHERND